MTRSSVVVGIDLGTSHTALAWAPVATGAVPRAFAIPQWLAGRGWGDAELLASVLYSPREDEMPALPGDASALAAGHWIIGDYARVRSQETVGRSVSSAKSWLCHSAVDRLGAILPWGESAVPAKLSPVEASERILRHAWRAFVAHHPELVARDVSVVLTVPASFDPMARKLTVIAAERAGLEVRLLEEPQAAFYEYLGRHADELATLSARRGALQVLVCDIGGGTTDFSLIDVEPRGSGLEFRRSAVGRHLLLGGDNMDLAVARHVEARLGEGSVAPARFGQLLLAARGAKEALLGPNPPPQFPLRLLGGGSSLFAERLSLDLPRRDIEALILDGFFPLGARGEKPSGRRSGLTTFGLPFERDPAITRHLWEFLERHAGGVVPGALLLNGGVARSPLLASRLLECLRSWGGGDVSLLTTDDTLLSVCGGAVRYGLSLAGYGPRIEGGAAQGYYVGVDAAGAGQAAHALCVVPRGAREGERHVAGTRQFELVLGEPVRFDLYASDLALHPPGALVALDAGFQALPRVTAELGKRGEQGTVNVQLEGELSAVGTVDLGLSVVPAGPSAERRTAQEGPQRFSLAFELDGIRPAAAEARTRARSSADEARLAAAVEALQLVFGKGRKDVSGRDVKDLVRTLEHKLGPRKEWDLEQTRRLCDVLLESHKARQRSEDHERLFWMLAGHCLRPGFGHPRDAARVQVLWPLFDGGLAHRGAERGWQQFWIAWRRVAGGLAETEQQRARERVDPWLAPAELKLRKSKAFQPLARAEMRQFASQLERLQARRRSELGGWLLEGTWSDRDPRLWTDIASIGARVPAYASAHFVLPPVIVQRWVEQLLRERWELVPTAAAAALRMCRVTGDEARDLPASLRQEVSRALERSNAPAEWAHAVLEYVEVTAAERSQALGDDLPLGLRLIEMSAPNAALD